MDKSKEAHLTKSLLIQSKMKISNLFPIVSNVVAKELQAEAKCKQKFATTE